MSHAATSIGTRNAPQVPSLIDEWILHLLLTAASVVAVVYTIAGL